MQTRFRHRFSRDFEQIQTLLYLLSRVLSKATAVSPQMALQTNK